MNVHDLKNAWLFVGAAGGEVTVSSADGEVIFSEGLTPGRYRGKEWVEFMTQPGDQLHTSGDVSPVGQTGLRLRPQNYGPAATESGANPDFVVTSATRMQRELERKLNLLDAKTDSVDRRLASLNNLAKRTRGEDVEVVEKKPKKELTNADDNADDTIPPAGGADKPSGPAGDAAGSGDSSE